MTELDPKIVRKVARSAMTLAAQRRDDIDHAILRHGNLGDRPESGEELREYRAAYGALFGAVRAEMHTATVAVSWPDEQPTAAQDADVRAVKALLEALAAWGDAPLTMQRAEQVRALYADRIAKLDGE